MFRSLRRFADGNEYFVDLVCDIDALSITLLKGFCVYVGVIHLASKPTSLRLDDCKYMDLLSRALLDDKGGYDISIEARTGDPWLCIKEAKTGTMRVLLARVALQAPSVEESEAYLMKILKKSILNRKVIEQSCAEHALTISRLQSEVSNFRALADEAVLAKVGAEAELFDRFCEVLNAKKERIRELTSTGTGRVKCSRRAPESFQSGTEAPAHRFEAGARSKGSYGSFTVRGGELCQLGAPSDDRETETDDGDDNVSSRTQPASSFQRTLWREETCGGKNNMLPTLDDNSDESAGEDKEDFSTKGGSLLLRDDSLLVLGEQDSEYDDSAAGSGAASGGHGDGGRDGRGRGRSGRGRGRGRANGRPQLRSLNVGAVLSAAPPRSALARAAPISAWGGRGGGGGGVGGGGSSSAAAVDIPAYPAIGQVAATPGENTRQPSRSSKTLTVEQSGEDESAGSSDPYDALV